MNRVTGSIQNKNNKGIYHMMVRIKAPDGTVTNRSKSTGIKVGRTKREDEIARREANAMLTAWIAELEAECEAAEEAKNNQRLMQAIDDWLEWKKNYDDLRTNSYQGYLSYLKNHIKPYFEQSNPYLQDVKPSDIQAFVDYLAAKSLKTESIKKIMVPVRGAFDDAVRIDTILYNPCDKIKLPNSKNKFKGKSLTREQVIKLISTIEQDPYQVGIMLAIWLGLRRSEIAGLRWQDVDLVQDKVFIRNTKTRFSDVIEAEQTKSESSKRDIGISLYLHNYLVMVRATQDRNKELCGGSYKDDIHVCVWADGTTQSAEYPYRKLQALLKELDLPRVRLHDLRHTAATLLVDDGASLVNVKDFMGHDDINVTSGTYVHSGESAQRDIASTMERILTAV